MVLESLFLGIVIPTYNERENIINLLNALHEKLRDTGVGFKIIVVDDNSPDGTSKVVEEYMKEKPNVSLIVRESKKGLGSAIMDGFRALIKDDRVTHIATMDADFSHRPEDLVRMLPKSREADLVQGSRYVRGGQIMGWGIHRRVVSRTANLIARLLFGWDTRDYTSNFRIYSRRLIDEILAHKLDDSYDWVVESIALAKMKGFKVVEVPIVFINRERGSSKLGILDIVKWFSNVMRIKRRLKHSLS